MQAHSGGKGLYYKFAMQVLFFDAIDSVDKI